jgi:hypothetical protein
MRGVVPVGVTEVFRNERRVRSGRVMAKQSVLLMGRVESQNECHCVIWGAEKQFRRENVANETVVLF